MASVRTKTILHVLLGEYDKVKSVKVAFTKESQEEPIFSGESF